MAQDHVSFRQRVLEHVDLLASAEQQLAYERDVPQADIPAELICGFTNDLFHPKDRAFVHAFTHTELRDLSELYGLLCVASRALAKLPPHSVANLLKLPEWRTVMTHAAVLATDLQMG